MTGNVAPLTGAIGVIALHIGGREEIPGASNIAETVKKIFPSAEVPFAIFSPTLNAEEEKKLPKKVYPREKLVEGLRHPVMESAAFLAKISRMAVLILFPFYVERHIPPSVMKACQSHGVRIIGIREFGSKRPVSANSFCKVYTLGVNRLECGLLFQEHLVDDSRTNRSLSHRDKLQHLAQLSAETQKLILREPYSKNALDRFDAHNKLYVGYCHVELTALAFIQAIVKLQTGSCTIVIPNNRLLLFAFLGYHSQILQDLNLFLKARGFSRLELMPDGIALTISSDPGFTLRLIISAVSQSEFEALLKASEPECLSTGEQSLFDFLSLRKRTACEAETYSFYGLKDLFNILHEHDGYLGTLFRGTMTRGLTFEELKDHLDGNAVDRPLQPLHETLSRFYAALKSSKDLSMKWESFMAFLYCRYRLTPRLAKILTEHLTPPSHSVPVFQKVLLRLPEGKPDPLEPLVDPCRDRRTRVLQAGEKGDTSSYYGLNALRPRFRQVGSDSLFPKKRQFELICSRRRKLKTWFDAERLLALSVIADYGPSPGDAKRWMKSKITSLNSSQSPMQEEIRRFFSSLTHFCAQEKYPNLFQFIEMHQTREMLEIDLQLLKDHQIEPEHEHQKLSSYYPKPWAKFSEMEKMLFCYKLVFRVSCEVFGLKNSPWHPTQPISQLIEAIRKYGPHLVQGFFGRICYRNPPDYSGVIDGQEFRGWMTENNGQNHDPLLHSIILVGASEDSGGVVFFNDPADESPPDKPRPLYALSYEKIYKEIADVMSLQHLQEDRTRATHPDGSLVYTKNPYAFYSPFFNHSLK